MSVPSQKKPNTGALRWIAGLMGRMDQHMASVVPGLAAAMAPKPMPKCIPFHKRAGYVQRVRNSAGGRRKAAAAARRAANATVPVFATERVRRPAVHPLRDAEGNAYTLTGGRDPITGARCRMWVAGLSNNQRNLNV